VDVKRGGIRVGYYRVRIRRSSVKVGPDLRGLERVEYLRRHWLSAFIANKSSTEVPDSLQRRRHGRQRHDARIEPEVVIAARKEELVFDDRARNGTAEFVHFERRPRISIGLVGVGIRVQRLVAEHVAPLSMKLIRAGFRGHGNYALPSPVLGAEVIAD